MINEHNKETKHIIAKWSIPVVLRFLNKTIGNSGETIITENKGKITSRIYIEYLCSMSGRTTQTRIMISIISETNRMIKTQ